MAFCFCKGKFLTYFLLRAKLFCFFFPNGDTIFNLKGSHEAFSREGGGRANETVYGCVV